VHLVQLQVRIGLEQAAPRLAAEGERLLWLVDFDTALVRWTPS
jgi:hypothetical protein